MKVLFVTIGDEQIASSRTRIYEFLPFFESRGVQTKVIPFIRYLQNEHFLPFRGMIYTARLSRFFSIIDQASRYDVIVVQRLMIPSPFLEILRKKNPNLVLDLDDAIYSSHAKPFFISFYRSLRYYKAVLVSNQFLQEELKNHARRLIHLPTCVNTRYFKPSPMSRNPSRVTIGWVGTNHTEKYLNLVGDCIRDLAGLFTHIQFHVISSGNGVFKDLPFAIKKKWSLAAELRDLGQLDIGIMPLSDGYWERAKSGYKILQYLALGIPVVASGIGVNPQLVQHGQTGYIAQGQGEWFRYLSLLIQDPLLRQEMGCKGRRWAIENYDNEVHFHKFYGALTQTLNQELT